MKNECTYIYWETTQHRVYCHQYVCVSNVEAVLEQLMLYARAYSLYSDCFQPSSELLNYLMKGFFSLNFFLIFDVLAPIRQYFSYIMATSFSGGRMRSIQREPLTMGKQQVNFITCGCESSAPFLIYKSGREPTSWVFLSIITYRTKIIADSH